MNNKIVNAFIFKYLNNGIENNDILDLIPIGLYKHIELQLTNYIINKDKAKLNFDQYQFELYQNLINEYSSQLEKILNEKNKK